jgi:UDP-N-acetylmuramate dehydrogenase
MSMLADKPSFAETTGLGTVQRNRPLAPMTRYRLGGPADWFVRPQSVGQLADLWRRCRDENYKLRILGGGANVLVDDDGVDGVVARLDAREFTDEDWESGRAGKNEPVLVKVGGGCDMARFILRAARRGLSGLECMSGIPGTVGGCIRMNAGGRWGDISGVVEEVTVLHDGDVRRLGREEVGFGYRHTRLGDRIVLGAVLRLVPDDPIRIQQRCKEIWHAKNLAQPMGAHNAGCVFKNPSGDSAGRLIDAAGLKNRQLGSARVSGTHANFIVAGVNGRARDVLDLIQVVRRTVAEKFGVHLDLEIDVWRRPGPRDAGRAPG